MAESTTENLGGLRNGRDRSGGGSTGNPARRVGLKSDHRPPVLSWRQLAFRTSTCHAIASVVTTIVLFYPALLLFDRAPPFEFVVGTISPARMDGKIYPGGPVTIEWRIKELRHADCGGTIRRTLVDSKGTVYEMAPVTALYAQLREQDHFKRTFSLPDGFSSGPAAYYQAKPTYWCNWVQKAIWPVSAESPRVYFNVDQFPFQIIRP
jgi:hypothetical protein